MTQPFSPAPEVSVNSNGQVAVTGKQLHLPTSILNANRTETTVQLASLGPDGKPKALPSDLNGHAFIVAALPDRQPLSGSGSADQSVSTNKVQTTEHHVYNGDGMIYRLDFVRQEEQVTAQLKTAIAKTPCYYLDQATRSGKFADYGFHNAGFARIGKLGSRNQLNTAFATMGDRLFVTFDAGRPYEIHPVTLELLAPLGAVREWFSPLPDWLTGQMVFSPYQISAHPVADPVSGELFTTNYSTGASRLLPALVRENMAPQVKRVLGGFTDLIRWSGEGPLERWRLTLEDGAPVIVEQSLHQLAITRNYIVLVDIAFTTEVSQFFFPLLGYPWLESIPSDELKRLIKSLFLRLRKQLPFTNVYIVNRSDLQNGGGTTDRQKTLKVSKIVLPREVSHFMVDYDDEPGYLTLHAAHNNAWDVTEWIRDWDEPAFPDAGLRTDLVGAIVGPMDVSFLGRYRIDADRGALLDSQAICDPNRTWAVSLYTHSEQAIASKVKFIYWLAWGFYRELIPKRIFDSYKSYRYRGIALEDFLAKYVNEDRGVRLVKLDTVSMQLQDHYRFPDTCFASSPQFIPKLGQAGEQGYIICTVTSDRLQTPNSTSDEIWIFDADNLRQGPLYKLTYVNREEPEQSLNFGLTMHTTWLSEERYQRAAGWTQDAQAIRRESVLNDYEQAIAQLPDLKQSPELAAFLKEQIITKFVAQTPEADLS